MCGTYLNERKKNQGNMKRKIYFLCVLCLGVTIGVMLYVEKSGHQGFTTGMVRPITSKVQVGMFLRSSNGSNSESKTSETNLDDKSKTLVKLAININSSSCTNLTIPLFNNFKYTWQTVLDGNMYMYSAFLDGNRIRLVGIWTPSERPRICQLWYKDNATNGVTVKTRDVNIVRISGGEAGHRFHTTYVTCQLQDGNVPFAVSIIDDRQACAEPSNLFPVYRPKIGELKQFSVCVPPLHGNFPSASRLIEWIEMNRLLGVEFFTFYNFNSDQLVSDVLESYRKNGIVEILPWNIPTRKLHYLGQIASMHDCLDRNRKRYKYTGFFDLDEFIVPHSAEDITWMDLFKRLPAEGCSYSFRSSFFVGNYTTELYGTKKLGSDFILKNSVLLNVLKRSSLIFGHQVRSKIIVKPEEVETFGVHLTFSCKPGFTKRLVEPGIAMLHHYREGATGQVVNDSSALKYRGLLQKALEKAPFNN